MGIFTSIKRAFTDAPEQAPEQAPAPDPAQQAPKPRAKRKRAAYGRLTPDMRTYAADLYRRGYSVAAIAAYAGVTQSRIYQVFVEDGVPTRGNGRTSADRRRAAALPPLPEAGR